MTHLPSGLAVVRQIKVLAVALAFVDRIAALTDWTVQEIGATPELRAQVQTALDQAYDDYLLGPPPTGPARYVLGLLKSGAALSGMTAAPALPSVSWLQLWSEFPPGTQPTQRFFLVIKSV